MDVLALGLLAPDFGSLLWCMWTHSHDGASCFNRSGKWHSVLKIVLNSERRIWVWFVCEVSLGYARKGVRKWERERKTARNGWAIPSITTAGDCSQSLLRSPGNQNRTPILSYPRQKDGRGAGMLRYRLLGGNNYPCRACRWCFQEFPLLSSP